MHLLLSPHNDDEALFASYLCLEHRPLVLTCLDGGRKAHFAPVEVRVQESQAAMAVLGCPYEHLWVPLDPTDWEGVERRILMHCTDPERVWAPFPEANGHRHHNHLGELATRMWPGRVSFYTTYGQDENGVHRTQVGEPVPRTTGWDELKRQALACYASQIAAEGTAMHFERPLDEWVVPTLRLNLGGEINRIPGYVNMDVSYGWKFEHGLGMWGTGSVEAITESHSLMYVAPEDWPAAFAEMARVLQPGGYIRLTHDAIGVYGSTRRHIRPGAALETIPELVVEHLEAAGIPARVVVPEETGFRDRSLIQQNYGQPPDVFHVEGRKPRGL